MSRENLSHLVCNLYKAAGTLRHPPHSPSNQPQRLLAAVGNDIRSCFPHPVSLMLIFCFRETRLASALPVPDRAGNAGQTARLPMLCAFWQIKVEETDCRLLLNSP
jgi:hypothetical protein